MVITNGVITDIVTTCSVALYETLRHGGGDGWRTREAPIASECDRLPAFLGMRAHERISVPVEQLSN